MSMKIVLTGTSCVGKTTLANALSKELNLPVIEEIARLLCQKKGLHNMAEAIDPSALKWEILNEQINQESKLKDFICDRSALDCWVFWQRWNLCQSMTEESEKYYHLAKEQTKKYSHVIYIPPMFTPEEDGFRWLNDDYRNQVDRIIRMSLYELNMLDRTLTITTDVFSQRKEQVLAWLKAKQ